MNQQQPPQQPTLEEGQWRDCKQTLDSLETKVIQLMGLCHHNTSILGDWKLTDQQPLWDNIDLYIKSLSELYDMADKLPGNHATPRKTLLAIDSGINPLPVLRAQVDESQNRQDLTRGQMAQAEIFRETFDNLLAQWKSPDETEARLKHLEKDVMGAFEKKKQKISTNLMFFEHQRLLQQIQHRLKEIADMNQQVTTELGQLQAEYEGHRVELQTLQTQLAPLEAQFPQNPALRPQIDQIRARHGLVYQTANAKMTRFQQLQQYQQQLLQQQQQIQQQQQAQMQHYQQQYQQQFQQTSHQPQPQPQSQSQPLQSQQQQQVQTQAPQQPQAQPQLQPQPQPQAQQQIQPQPQPQQFQPQPPQTQQQQQQQIQQQQQQQQHQQQLQYQQAQLLQQQQYQQQQQQQQGQPGPRP